MPPKPIHNTATREYFQPNKTTDSTSQSIDWPEESSSSSPGSSKSPAGKTPDGEMREQNKGLSPSPTPSNIVLSADMSDVGVLGELNQKMIDEGVVAEERKEKLVEKKEELEREREERMREWDEAKESVEEGASGEMKGKGKRRD